LKGKNIPVQIVVFTKKLTGETNFIILNVDSELSQVRVGTFFTTKSICNPIREFKCSIETLYYLFKPTPN